MNFKLLISIVFFSTMISFSNTMSKAQLKQATKVMRTVCQPKFKVTNAMVDNIKNGEFIDDPEVKCYISCIMTMAQTIKKGKINIDSAIRQIDTLLPPDMKEPAKKAIDQCRPVVEKYKDVEICETSFVVAQCMYKANPEIFLFP